ncbi:hypothetical protein HDU96_003745 [Phlyctochytrium bullatum]|nr:hypothetical protein HDU96_003745 [Phlyctochytrium bullatum]
MRLPPEISSEVLSYLDQSSLITSRRASRSWNRAIKVMDAPWEGVIKSAGIIGHEWLLTKEMEFRGDFSKVKFDVAPGFLIAQSANSFRSMSWPTLEHDLVKQCLEFKLVGRDLEDSCTPADVKVAGPVFVGLCKPQLPLRETSRIAPENQAAAGADSKFWKELLAVSLVKDSDTSTPKLLVSELDGKFVQQVTAEFNVRVDVTCMASNGNGLIAFGGHNGRIFLASVLEPAELRGTVPGWESEVAVPLAAPEASGGKTGRKRGREGALEGVDTEAITSGSSSRPSKKRRA